MPKGILLTGPPGSGKSLLLSLFYQLLPISKRRIHYHAFTLALYKEVFAEMNRRKSSDEEEWERKARNKELAGRKGWKSVFAGGRWDEEGKERPVWTKEEGVAFNSTFSCHFPLITSADFGKSRAENDPGIYCALVSLNSDFAPSLL